LHPRIVEWTNEHNIVPWTHQVEVWNAWESGSDVVITTPTGSGKTLAFTIPILEVILNTQSNVLAMFPLKALANDQVMTLRNLLSQFGLDEIVGVIDGETPQYERDRLLSTKRIILTNPYIIHANLGKAPWRNFLQTVQLMIVDELHSYAGVFGSEMAWVFQRMWAAMRDGVWAKHGQIIAASATLADPVAHLHNLTKRTLIYHVERTGAATPAKTWIVYPWRLESILELVGYLISHNSQTLVYANSRNEVERLATTLQSVYPDVPIAAYRAGYAQQERLSIENQLRSGKIRVVVATSALATGVDIGTLDAVVMANIPSDIAVLKQVAGRAGRRGQEATIAVFADAATPIGTLLLNPGGIQQMLNRTAAASADLHNPTIIEKQLLLLAQETPLTSRLPVMADLPINQKFTELQKSGALRYNGVGHVPTKPVRPHSLVIQGRGMVPLVINGTKHDTCSFERAITQFPPHAIVPYRGRLYEASWIKRSVAEEAQMVASKKKDADDRPNYTSNLPKQIHLTPLPSDSDQLPTRTQQVRTVRFFDAQRSKSKYAIMQGNCSVLTNVSGLRITEPDGRVRTFAYSQKDLLRSSYLTRGLAIQLANPVDHGFVHAMLLEAESSLGVTTNEVGEYHTRAGIVLYDRDGPRGAIDLLAKDIDRLITATRNRIDNCGCANGCLNCVILLNCRDNSDKELSRFALFGFAPRADLVLPQDKEEDAKKSDKQPAQVLRQKQGSR
jgi:DEAD/DEAH box helicase domain-containing protein